MTDWLYLQCFHALKSSVCLLDKKGKIIDMNETFCREFGYMNGELIDEPFERICVLDENSSTGISLNLQQSKWKTNLKQMDKSVIHVNIDNTAILNKNETIFFLQIEKVQKTEPYYELKTNISYIMQEMFNSIQEFCNEPMLAMDQRGAHIYSNKAIQDVMNVNLSQIKNDNLWDFLKKENKKLYQLMKKALYKENKEELEFYLEGEDKWYEIRMYHKGGILVYLFLNIENRKKTEQVLKDSELRYRSLVEHIPETITVHDGQKFIYMNAAGIQLFRANDIYDIVGSSLRVLFTGSEYSRTRENVRLLLTNQKKSTNTIFRIRCINGEFIEVEASTTMIMYRGQKAFRTIFKDVSERKKMDHLIRKSDKLSAVTQMAAGVAHEIRNPLTSVKGFLQLLEKEKTYNQTFLNLIMDELQRVEAIIFEYLTLAKPNYETPFEKMDLKVLLEQVMTLTETQSMVKNIVLDFDYEDVPFVYGSMKQMKQAIMNLIRNAIEAVSHNGSIRLRLSNHPDNQVCIEVEDDGCGISKERIERLGEPFYSTKEKGTGLGLMVCFKILEHHNGVMNIHSQLNIGTRIEVILPALIPIPKEVQFN